MLYGSDYPFTNADLGYELSFWKQHGRLHALAASDSEAYTGNA